MLHGAGGASTTASQPLATCEIYDPVTGVHYLVTHVTSSVKHCKSALTSYAHHVEHSLLATIIRRSADIAGTAADMHDLRL